MLFLSNPTYASLILCLASVLASPFPGDGVEYRLSLRAAGPDPPLPGRSGVSTDANGESWAHYGDDDLPEHGRHIDRNQAKHPGNHGAFPLAEGGQGAVNRKEALKGVDPAGHIRQQVGRGLRTRSSLQCSITPIIKTKPLLSIGLVLSQVA